MSDSEELVCFPEDEMFADVTNDVFEAAEKIPTGMLVAEPGMTLSRCLVSLEMMEPRMDCNLIGNMNHEDMNYDVLTPLQPGEVISVMDQLLGAEMAWHEGYALNQTIFSCHYTQAVSSSYLPSESNIDRFELKKTPAGEDPQPLPIMLDIVRVYSIAVLKTCQDAHSRVSSLPYRDQEEMSSRCDGQVLYFKVSAADLAERLAHFRLLLERMLRDPVEENNAAAIKGIIARLKIREYMLLSFDLDPTRPLWGKYWLSVWQATGGINEAASIPTPQAFSAAIQTKLSAAALPKPTVIKRLDEAVQALRNIARKCCNLTNVFNLKQSDFLSCPLFIQKFRTYQDGKETHIYPRACLYLLIAKNPAPIALYSLCSQFEALFMPTQPLLESARSLYRNQVPAEDVSTASLVNELREIAQEVHILFLGALLSNKSRMHRVLIGDIVSRYLACYNKSPVESVPMSIENQGIIAKPCSRWALLGIYESVLLWLESGSKLDLYQTHELCPLYLVWSYMRENLSLFYQGLNGTHGKAIDEADPTDSTPSSRTFSMHYIDYATNLNSGESLLLGSLSQLYSWMIGIGLLKLPTSPYYSFFRQFETRFRPFVQVCALAENEKIFNWDQVGHYIQKQNALEGTGCVITQVRHSCSKARWKLAQSASLLQKIRGWKLSEETIQALEEHTRTLNDVAIELLAQVSVLDRAVSSNMEKNKPVGSVDGEVDRILGTVKVAFKPGKYKNITLPHFYPGG